METIDTTPRWRGILQLLLGVGLTILFFYMMAPFLLPFMLGGICAILCYPLYTHLRVFFKNHLAAFFTTLFLSIGVLAPIIYLLYSGTYRVIALLKTLKIVRNGQTVEELAEHPVIRKGVAFLSKWISIDREWIQTQALDLLQSIVEKVSVIVGAFLGGMPGLFVAVFIVTLSTYFFLVDGAKFLRFLASLSPMKLDRSVEIYGSFERTCRGVVLGLFVSGVVQGLLMAILFVVTGLPDPIFIFLTTIVAGMVPIVGSGPIWIIAVVYHVFHNNMTFAIIMFIGGLAVSTSDNIVRPLVMKGHAEMHPLLALVSVFGAINLFGPTGIFLGPVIAAVFISFLRILSIELRRESISQVASTTA